MNNRMKATNPKIKTFQRRNLEIKLNVKKGNNVIKPNMTTFPAEFQIIS